MEFKSLHPQCFLGYAKPFSPFISANELNLLINIEEQTSLLTVEVNQTEEATKDLNGKTVLIKSITENGQRLLQPLNDQEYGDKGDYLVVKEAVLGIWSTPRAEICNHQDT